MHYANNILFRNRYSGGFWVTDYDQLQIDQIRNLLKYSQPVDEKRLRKRRLHLCAFNIEH